MTRLRRVLAVVATALMAVLLVAAPASAATICPVGWGSLPENVNAMGTGEVDNVRVGPHECYDRLVVDIDGPAAGYNVRYVDQVLTEGKGDVVPLAGGAKLNVVIRHPNYSSTVPVKGTLRYVSGFQTFRAVKYAGSFEGQTTIGLGVRARLPFRVWRIQGGHSMIVIDVAHKWAA